MAWHTIDWIIRGQEEVLTNYQSALEIWAEIERETEFADVEGIAEEVAVRQIQFEQQCGGRWQGQEVMVVSGIARLFSLERGFDENLAKARNIVWGIIRSTCSLEVKHHAVDVAKMYDLFDEEDMHDLERRAH